MRVQFADIETERFKETYELNQLDDSVKEYRIPFKLGCILEFDDNGKEIYRYFSKNQTEFCKEIVDNCSKNNVKVVYFHNLAFDSKFLFAYLLEKFDKIKPFRVNSKIHAIYCYKNYANGRQYIVLKLKD